MRNEGLNWFLKTAIDNGIAAVSENDRFVSSCHLCKTLFSNHKQLERLTPYMLAYHAEQKDAQPLTKTS